MPIKSRIRTVPHYPKQGVMFRDITTLLKDPVGFRVTISELVKRYEGVKVDRVAGIEARGFIVGSELAYQLGVGFVPIRKKGKLPAETVGHDQELEYGTKIQGRTPNYWIVNSITYSNVTAQYAEMHRYSFLCTPPMYPSTIIPMKRLYEQLLRFP